MVITPGKNFATAASLSLLLIASIACGKDSTSPPDTKLDGGWSGLTSQGEPIDLLVEENGVVLAVAGFAGGTCTAVFSREPPETPYPVTQGVFTINYPGPPGSITIAGSLEEDGAAAGTFTVMSTECGGTLDATWTAQRATTAAVNLAGTWGGFLGSSRLSSTGVTLTLAQTGTVLTGTYAVESGGMGTVAGTVLGRTITLTLSQTTAGCTGTFKGHGYLISGTLFFNYTGSDCLGFHERGRGSGGRL